MLVFVDVSFGCIAQTTPDTRQHGFLLRRTVSRFVDKTEDSKLELSGGEILIQALKEEGVEYLFGYPGGAVLHIYDALYQQNSIKHILVRHCLLYTSPSPRDATLSRMPSSA